jgi:hypothetical protein
MAINDLDIEDKQLGPSLPVCRADSGAGAAGFAQRSGPTGGAPNRTFLNV